MPLGDSEKCGFDQWQTTVQPPAPADRLQAARDLKVPPFWPVGTT